ncbi:MAG: hypothetical protein V2A34_08415 [Lentisphaerota bacterium]
MKKWTFLLALAMAGVLAQAEETLKDINFKEVLVAPESFKNDLVAYSANYLNFSTTFFPYMDKSGFSSTKHLMLAIGDPRLPVIAKKTDEVSSLVANLKPGALVRVTGKVKKFSSEPKDTMMPIFYVELKSLQLLQQPAESTSNPEKQGQPFKQHMKKHVAP